MGFNIQTRVTNPCFQNFALTPLSTPYAPFYAKILDNVFTPTECRSLLALVSAPASSEASMLPSGWHPAALSTNAPTQTVHTDFRNSDRALVVDSSTANFIYARLCPHVPELYALSPGGRWAIITGRPEKKQGPTWTLAGVNPRLSFLRYGPGHYFKPHCDGLNEVEGKKSFVTLHIYLNDAEGADDNNDVTSEVVPSSNIPTSPATDDHKVHLDVLPKAGRVLVFQQRMLVHSGEPVVSGIKYTIRSDFLFTEGPAEGAEALA
ncbi:hypothetical protein BDZ94DRAFT_1254084 [Collybia nuda]|uniref:Prolyl 4-hydroxylase alpha subunit domain-containing protein n=1 Tax=Collybia nuda TaxID=64659 RepID=A0A9P5YAP5_9AGAR|nr:hypothetical protein BDZ94DRAFT_1254084 [Collybia nuda]